MTPSSFSEYQWVLLSFGAVVITIVIAITGFEAWKHARRKKLQQSTWPALAAAHQLTFVPAGLRQNVRVTGRYRSYPLELTTTPRGANNDRRTYTTLSLTLDYPRTGGSLALPEECFNAPPTVETVVGLLAPVALRHSPGEQVKIDAGGQNLRYEHPDIETDEAYLQFLLDWLASLAGAYPRIVGLGGEVMPVLGELAAKNQAAYPLITRLAQEIGRETRARISERATRLFCRDCFTCCGVHKVDLGLGQTATYYGCRLCGQSRRLFAGKVVAVLDNRTPAKAVEQGEFLEVNWLVQRTLFDFERVEIRQASAEDIERFAVQVGNDTDHTRTGRYRRMPCLISASDEMSPESLRILQQVFTAAVRPGGSRPL